MYEAMATSKTPALIIYLLDVSGSMGEEMDATVGRMRKIDVLPRVLKKAAKVMVRRATKGETMSARYRVGMFAYSSKVEPVYKDDNGNCKIWPITDIGQVGVPKIFNLQDTTDTYSGFLAVKRLLEQEIPKLPSESPAPLVCHLTDGHFTTQDPSPIVNEIKQLRVNDGFVLLENIYISSRLQVSTTNAEEWSGFRASDNIGDEYGNRLLEMSSPLPGSYYKEIHPLYPNFSVDSKMMFPGVNEDFVSLAFVMSTSTKVDNKPSSLDR